MDKIANIPTPILLGSAALTALFGLCRYHKYAHPPVITQTKVNQSEKADEEHDVLILGAGLVGALMAATLTKIEGFKDAKIKLIDRRQDLRADTSQSPGRSINLALSERGFSALDKIGIVDQARKLCLPMTGRMIHPLDKEAYASKYSSSGTLAINSIHRGDLNCLLLNESQKNGVSMEFEWKTTRVDINKGLVWLKNEKTSASKVVSAKHILACDGAYSVTRFSMQRTPGKAFNYQQQYLQHGYKELTIPAKNNKHQISNQHLHIWGRGQFMMIALPNLDGSFTVTCFFPYEGEYGFHQLDSLIKTDPKKVEQFFRQQFPDVVDLMMPDLMKDFASNPTGSLMTVYADPWTFGRVCLFGDAAHAVVPFFGQGMNAGFEDVEVFGDLIKKHNITKIDDLGTIFDAYSRSRVKNGHAIANMALENHYEMRDKTSDPDWLLQKKVADYLGNNISTYYTRYELVSFSCLDYSQVAEYGRKNEGVLRQLMRTISNESQISSINLDTARDLIQKELSFTGIEIGKYTRIFQQQ